MSIGSIAGGQGQLYGWMWAVTRLGRAVILMHAFTCLFVHTFACLLVCAFARSLVCAFARLRVCGFAHSLIFVCRLAN